MQYVFPHFYTFIFQIFVLRYVARFDLINFDFFNRGFLLRSRHILNQSQLYSMLLVSSEQGPLFC